MKDPESVSFDDPQRLSPVGDIFNDSESHVTLIKLDLRGLNTYTLSDEDKYKGVFSVQLARLRRCDELKLGRIALRIARAHHLLEHEPNTSPYSPTGRWFQSGGKVIHIDSSYLYALVKVSSNLDC